jgi:hypothetical protein
MTIEQVIRDLRDSEINAEIGWCYDGVWWVKLGDPINGYDAEGRCAYADETAELLRRMAVMARSRAPDPVNSFTVS